MLRQDRRVVARLRDGIRVVSVIDASHMHHYDVYRDEAGVIGV